MTQLTPGMQLAEELAQAIINDDNKAAQVAAINIVGTLLDNFGSIAQSLEKLANSASAVVEFGQHINVQKVDR